MKKRYFPILVFLFSLLLQKSVAKAEYGTPFIRNYTPKEYGFGSQNWAIAQDNRRVMYFGNSDGVLEFDGNQWRIIKTANNSFVRSLATDSNGTVYIGASGEFGYLYPDSTGLQSYISLLEKLPEEKRKFSNVWNVFATSHGVYFFTEENIFHYHDSIIDVINTETNLFPSFINDRLYFPKKTEGICCLYKGIYTPLPGTDLLFSEHFKHVIILPYSENKLLIYQDGKGFNLYRLNPSLHESPETSRLEKFDVENEETLIDNRLYSGIQMKNGNYAFSIMKGGIVVLDQKGRIVRLINSDQGLLKSAVHYVFQDSYANLWVGLNKGIAYIQTSSPITHFSAYQGIDKTVLKFKRFNGNIFLGCFTNISYFSKKENIFTPVKGSSSYCFDFTVFKNELLAAASGGILHIVDYKPVHLTTLPRVMCFGKSGKFNDYIFCGLYDGFAAVGINKIKSGSLKVFNKTVFKEIKESIRKIVSDNRGDLWLTAQFNGIIHIAFQDSSISHFTITRYTREDGLPALKENGVYYFNEHVFVSTSSGIFKAELVDSINNKYHFVREKKFFEDSVSTYVLFRDHTGKIWANTINKGFGYFTKKNATEYAWVRAPFNKLPTMELNDCCVEPDNTLWCCTVEGLYKFDQSVKKDYTPHYKALIRKVTVNNDSIIYNGTSFNILTDTARRSEKTGRLAEMATLSSSSHILRFNCAVPFFEHSEANRFSYLLQGFDKEWSDWTTENFKEYTNLPHGGYCFQVKARNIFNHESEEDRFHVRILPPWYKTAWARFFFSIIFIVLIIGIVQIATYLRLRTIKKRELELQRIVKQKTKDLQQSNRQLEEANQFKTELLSMAAHDLKNPLGVIMASHDLIKRKITSPEYVKEKLHLILETVNRMTELINETLNSATIDSTDIRLKKEVFDLGLLSIEVAEGFKLTALEKDQLLKIAIEKSVIIEADIGRIKAILENLLSNAIKYSPLGKTIRFSVKRENSSAVITVTDEGPGFTKVDKKKVFGKFQRLSAHPTGGETSLGLGLFIVKKLVELHNGTISIESEEGRGCSFIVKFALLYSTPGV